MSGLGGLVACVLAFLGVSLLLYVLLGGADFGAGILELRLGAERREEQRKLVSHAMAPVWEANHVWLILALVILFMGFPEIYTLISTYLYIPLMAVLLGIVARGSAFTFRHYDSLGSSYHGAYSRVFAWSSLWTSFFLGVTAGAMMLGRIDPGAADFRRAYLAPWLNVFCASVGLFACALFAFLAAVYLVGEAGTPELRALFRRKARLANLWVVVSGALVFTCAEGSGFSLARVFFASPLSLACFAMATLLWLPFWGALGRMGPAYLLRSLAAAIVAAVLLGWFAARYPVALAIATPAGQQSLTFGQAAAPEPTLRALLVALLAGIALILPALAYLLRVFKWDALER